MSSDLGALHPRFTPLARWFLDAVRYSGFTAQVTSTLRSHKRQQELYDEYLAGGRDLPVLPPGRSLHEAGLAFDVVIDGEYRGETQAAVGRAWQQLGGVWGGSGDPVHFQPPRSWIEAIRKTG